MTVAAGVIVGAVSMVSAVAYSFSECKRIEVCKNIKNIVKIVQMWYNINKGSYTLYRIPTVKYSAGDSVYNLPHLINKTGTVLLRPHLAYIIYNYFPKQPKRKREIYMNDY